MAFQINSFDISIDIKKVSKVNNITLVTGDTGSNQFVMSMLSDAVAYDLTGLQAEVVFGKPDGTVVVQDSGSGVTIADNVVTCLLSANSTSSAGTNYCEVRILDGSKVLTSSNFQFNVRDSLLTDGVIESTSYFPIYTQLMTAIDQEADRVVAESVRESQEDDRQDNESVRELNEQNRNVFQAHSTSIVWYQGNRVSSGGKVYIAIQDVPVSTSITNTVYWAEMGVETANTADILALSTDLLDVQAFVGYTNSDIYGIEWDVPTDTVKRVGGATSLTRADFDSIAPWKDIKRCILTDDRVVLAYYGETGYTETGVTTVELIVGGVTYPIGTAVQVMVEIPEHYYKVVPLDLEKIPDGDGFQYSRMRMYISPKPYSGFKKVEKFYYSAYEGSVYDVSASAYLLTDEQVADFTATTGDKLSSIANAKPCSGLTQNLTIGNSHTIAQNRGVGWQIEDLYLRSIVSNLMLVEYNTFDMQTAIGIGVGNKNSGTGNEAENTGQTASLGNVSGMASGTNGLVSVSYRGIENFWGNLWTRCHGLNIEGYGLHNIWYAFDNFQPDIKVDPYKKASFTLAKINGYINKVGYDPNIDFAFLPTETLGSSNTYLTDPFYQNIAYSGFLVALFGGAWTDGLVGGTRFLNATTSSTLLSRYVGARLVCKHNGGV